MSFSEYFVGDRICWITLPTTAGAGFPVSSIGELRASIARAISDRAVEAIVLIGGEGGFPRGVPVDTYANQLALTDLRLLMKEIEASSLPVVAAINGAAINEGFELALAAHYRVAPTNALFAMSQIALGLIPAAGGTQRLPRLTGAKGALDLLLNGQILSAEAAFERGILDQIIHDDLALSTERFVRQILSDAKGERPTGKLVAGVTNPGRYQDQMAEAMKLVTELPLHAAKCVVECVQAAQLMPIENGLALEEALFKDCEETDEARCLRYVSQAEQRLRLHQVALPAAPSLALVGASAAAAGLCVSALDAGLAVSGWDMPQSKSSDLRARVLAVYDQAVQKQRMSPGQRSRRMGLLNSRAGQIGGKPLDLVLDDGSVPAEVLSAQLRKIPADQKKDAVLLSFRPPSEVRQLTAMEAFPGACLAGHLSRPAHVAKVIELSVVRDPMSRARAIGAELSNRLGKMPIWTQGQEGAVATALRNALWEATEQLMLMGAEPKAIDEAMLHFGFSRGPLAARDDLGLDVSFSAAPAPVAAALCRAGRRGRSAGLGFFRYLKNDPRPRADSVVLWTLASLREEMGMHSKAVSEEDIRLLCLGAMANVGARLLAEEAVAEASDIDILAVHELGFPRRRGGPMKAADEVGLFTLQRVLEDHAAHAPDLWAPHPLFEELVKYGQSFEKIDLPRLSAVS